MLHANIRRQRLALLLVTAIATATPSLSGPQPAQASTYGASLNTGHQLQQIANSPVPVALTNSETFHEDPFGSGLAAAIAAGGPGLANGVANVVMSTDPNVLTGRTSWGVTSGSFSSFDGIVITGPPGTPPGALVEYSVNVFVTADMQASHGGPGSPYSGASGRVRWGTSSSIGFIGGIELGSIHVQGNSVYSATGIFSSATIDHPQNALVDASPTFMVRTGDAISVSLQVETSAGVGDDRFDYGMGGAHMAAKASMQATLTGVSVFNFSEAGWTANSMDGTIVNNQLSAPPNHGDFDGNSRVDGHDFLHWQRTLGTVGDRSAGADGNANGFVDFDDVSNWRTYVGQSEITTRSVPEPAAAELAAVAAFVLSLFVTAARGNRAQVR